jgi:RNA polymerase sigma factor (sigma-70 family)
MAIASAPPRLRTSASGGRRHRSISPTSAVQGGQDYSFGHLGKKSALHFGGQGHAGADSQALREVQAQAVQEPGLSGIGADHTAQTELAPVGGGQHDVRALDAAEFLEDGAWAVTQARALLPLLQGFPQHVQFELRNVLTAALDSLPEDYRAIAVLRDVEGLSPQDVSQITGLSVGAVKTRTHRARLVLRKRLGEYLSDRP